jgi:hypothetical protein
MGCSARSGWCLLTPGDSNGVTAPHLQKRCVTSSAVRTPIARISIYAWMLRNDPLLYIANASS